MKKSGMPLTEKDRHNMEVMGMNEREYRRRSRNAQRLAKVTALAGAVALVAASIFMNLKADTSAERHFDKVEQEALAETTNAWNAVVVLREGATYRKAPLNANSDQGGDPNTMAGKVAKGQVLRIERPLVYRQNNNQYWLGFTSGEDNGIKEISVVDQYFWVNITELENQNKNGQPFIEVYNYPESAEGENYDNYLVSFDERGLPLGTLNGKGGSVGLSTSMSESNFKSEIKFENLTISHGK